VKAEPKPDDAKPQPDANRDVAALLNISLGELLVAGIAKDPEDTGRVIAAAIEQAGPSPANKPKDEAKPAPDGKEKGQTPTKVTPEAAD
jgi:hypothetical protein